MPDTLKLLVPYENQLRVVKAVPANIPFKKIIRRFGFPKGKPEEEKGNLFQGDDDAFILDSNEHAIPLEEIWLIPSIGLGMRYERNATGWIRCPYRRIYDLRDSLMREFIESLERDASWIERGSTTRVKWGIFHNLYYFVEDAGREGEPDFQCEIHSTIQFFA